MQFTIQCRAGHRACFLFPRARPGSRKLTAGSHLTISGHALIVLALVTLIRVQWPGS